MKITTMLLAVLALELSVATRTSSASAAVRNTEVTRDAAIARCNAQAHKQFPGNYRDWGNDRNFVYKSCMFNAGELEWRPPRSRASRLGMKTPRQYFRAARQR